MVNLRFHIVSITAVFLALALGIFVGSTLLQRVTVDTLRSRQASLDEKIQDRVEENTAFREALGSYDSQMESFGDDGLPPLLGGQLRDPVITVAMRGIDEVSLDAAREDLVASGASDAGTIWFDERVDVSDEGRRSQVAEALDLAGVEVDEEAVRDQLAEAVAEALAPSTSPDAGDPAAVAEGAAALEQMQSDGLLEWETPQGAPRSLPATGLRVVVASGEGAELGADAVAIPLLRELVRTRPGVAVAAEVMNPRSSVGEVERELDGQEPVRGDFVDAVAGDEELGDRISTIDDLDQPFGRLTLVQVLAEGLDAAPGRYGRTESATQQFPAGRVMADVAETTGPQVPDARGFARSAVGMSALTAVSRGTGFLRIVVVTNVLGTTYLANTYQTANTVPNILFELLAAGALQAVLVPAMVELVDSKDQAETRHVVGAILGLSCTMLAAVAAAAAVVAPHLMRIMVSDVPDAGIREAEVRLGTFLLFFFLPQIVLYAANVVATAVLNATGSFALPVFAPTINNVVVIGSYLLFALVRGDAPPSLELTTGEKLILALGTLGGVVAFCAVPIIAAARRVPLRPNLDHRHPMVRRLLRQGGWAALFLALTQVLLIVMLQISNRREGAVAVFQLAFAVYLLPHALFAVPVMTTRFPSMSRQAAARDWAGFSDTVGRGTRSITFLTLPASALLIALAEPLTRLVVHGDAADRQSEIADAIAGFAPGVVGFGLLLFFTRACYAHQDARTPTLVNLLAVAVGVVAMWLVASRVDGIHLVAGLGLASALAQTVGAASLWWVVHRTVTTHHQRLDASVPLLRNVAAAVISGTGVWFVVDRVGGDSVATAVVELAVGGLLGAGLFLVLQALFGGPAPVAAVRSLGAAGRHPGVAVA